MVKKVGFPKKAAPFYYFLNGIEIIFTTSAISNKASEKMPAIIRKDIRAIPAEIKAEVIPTSAGR